jgi:hypothetical protein
MKKTNRKLLIASLLLYASAGFSEQPLPTSENDASDADRHVVMHKNPGCGCCDVWADHMRSFDFTVEVIEDPKLYDLKDDRGIPQPLFSCHTAFVEGYFVEGHVPAQDVLTLLKLKPENVAGIAVPGMPLGSPGMEHPRPQSFNTIALLSDGNAYVFAQHPAGEDFSASGK